MRLSAIVIPRIEATCTSRRRWKLYVIRSPHVAPLIIACTRLVRVKPRLIRLVQNPSTCSKMRADEPQLVIDTGRVESLLGCEIRADLEDPCLEKLDVRMVEGPRQDLYHL